MAAGSEGVGSSLWGRMPVSGEGRWGGGRMLWWGGRRRLPRREPATHAMERSGPLPAMERGSDAPDGEERAHTMESSGVGRKEEKCVVHFLDGP